MPPRFGGNEATAYLRCYITIHPNKYNIPGLLTIPVVVSDSSDVSSEAIDNGWVMVGIGLVVSTGVILGIEYACALTFSVITSWFMTNLSGLYMMLNNVAPDSMQEDTYKDNQ